MLHIGPSVLLLVVLMTKDAEPEYLAQAYANPRICEVQLGLVLEEFALYRKAHPDAHLIEITCSDPLTPERSA